MQFQLTRPCKDCPFRSDIPFYLHPARVVAILEGIFQDEETFTCHNAAYGRWHRDTYRPDRNDQHCAGALLLIHREDVGHRMTQIAEQLGLYDPRTLDLHAPVFPTVEAMLERFEALELATTLLVWLARVRPRPPQQGDSTDGRPDPEAEL
jgi:hypothetical protein